jgi:hypothetical protein
MTETWPMRKSLERAALGAGRLCNKHSIRKLTGAAKDHTETDFGVIKTGGSAFQNVDIA